MRATGRSAGPPSRAHRRAESVPRQSSRRPRRRSPAASRRGQPPQHVMQDAARAEIFQLVVGIDPATGSDRALRAVGPRNLHLDILPWLDVGNTGDREGLVAREAKALGILTFVKLQWQHA